MKKEQRRGGGQRTGHKRGGQDDNTQPVMKEDNTQPVMKEDNTQPVMKDEEFNTVTLMKEEDDFNTVHIIGSTAIILQHPNAVIFLFSSIPFLSPPPLFVLSSFLPFSLFVVSLSQAFSFIILKTSTTAAP